MNGIYTLEFVKKRTGDIVVNGAPNVVNTAKSNTAEPVHSNLNSMECVTVMVVVRGII